MALPGLKRRKKDSFLYTRTQRDVSKRAIRTPFATHCQRCSFGEANKDNDNAFTTRNYNMPAKGIYRVRVTKAGKAIIPRNVHQSESEQAPALTEHFAERKDS